MYILCRAHRNLRSRMRRVVGRIINGEYVRVDEVRDESPEARQRYGAERTDYFAGVSPSDLARLDNRQLFLATSRLFEHRFTGSPMQRAYMAEAYHACVVEARKRRATLHD